MKRILIVFCVCTLVFGIAGCEKVEDKGNYKEGTYFGYKQEESDENILTTTAVVNVDEDGKIDSVFIDATYEKDGKLTTKKTLRDDYAMKQTSANIGKIEGGAEWFEQVESLEEAIIEKQGISFIKWNSDDKAKTDSVTGVTMNVDILVEAVNNALNDAKK